MQGDDKKRRSFSQTAGGVSLIALPLLIVTSIAVGMRITHHTAPSSEDLPTRNAARALIGPELHRVRSEHDRKTFHEAKKAATELAHKHLFPDGSQVAQNLTVTPKKRGRYQVRGEVSYRDDSHKTVSRRFEADLLHGPADNKWRLIDTEFLP